MRSRLKEIALRIPRVRYKWLWLDVNQLTSVPAEIGQLTSLEVLNLSGNQLTSVPAAIRELRAARCHVDLDDSVTVDE